MIYTFGSTSYNQHREFVTTQINEITVLQGSTVYVT